MFVGRTCPWSCRPAKWNMDPEEMRDDLVWDMLERALSAIEAKP